MTWRPGNTLHITSWSVHVTHSRGTCHQHSHTMWSIMSPPLASHVVHYVTHTCIHVVHHVNNTHPTHGSLFHPHPQNIRGCMLPTSIELQVPNVTHTHKTCGSSCHAHLHLCGLQGTWWKELKEHVILYVVHTGHGDLPVTHIHRTPGSSCNQHSQTRGSSSHPVQRT